MPDILADQILELDKDDLSAVLRLLQNDDRDAYDKLKELVDDVL